MGTAMKPGKENMRFKRLMREGAILNERAVAYVQQLVRIRHARRHWIFQTQFQFNTLIVLLPCEPKASNHPKVVFC